MTPRLDAELVARGLARSRGAAAELLRAGAVQVNGSPARKAAQPVADADVLTVDAGPQRVGRAGYKLDAAFEAFGTSAPEPLDVRGRRCLDVGACTGGFTQVLLERGAAHVTALDVGHGQLAPELAADPRVVDAPGRNVRDLSPSEVGGPFDVVVADLSFISLRLVLPSLAGLLRPDGQGVLLIKPQFEVGRAGLGKHGIVTDLAARRTAIVDVATAARSLGLPPRAVAPTGVPGGGGNHEYLLWVTRRAQLALADDEAAARAAVRGFEGTR